MSCQGESYLSHTGKEHYWKLCQFFFNFPESVCRTGNLLIMLIHHKMIAISRRNYYRAFNSRIRRTVNVRVLFNGHTDGERIHNLVGTKHTIGAQSCNKCHHILHLLLFVRIAIPNLIYWVHLYIPTYQIIKAYAGGW